MTGRTYKNPARELIIVDHDSRDRSTEPNREHLEKIKLQIIAAGKVYQPLTAWVDGNDNLVLDDGRTRLKALDELLEEGLDFDFYVHIVARPDSIIERLRREFMLNEGKPLEMVEKGRRFAELTSITNPETGKLFTQTEIARVFGVSQTSVSAALRLVEEFTENPELKEAVESGSISVSDAVQSIRRNKPKRKKAGGGRSKRPNPQLVGNLIIDNGRLVEEEGKYFIEIDEDTARVCFPQEFEDVDLNEGDF